MGFLLQIVLAMAVFASGSSAQAQMRVEGTDWNRDGRVDTIDHHIAQRYRSYDRNNDGQVDRGEWQGNARLFVRLDANRDGNLTMQEYTQGNGFVLDALGGPVFRFSDIDANNDGWVTRREWNMSSADFKRLDINFDNRISRFEFEHDSASDDRYSPAQFNALDANHDGWLTCSEPRMTSGEFARLDRNRDDRVSRFEFENAASPAGGYIGPRSAAWRTGYHRGVQEGLAAGREDNLRNQGWDLEGQREVERADSGYTPEIGLLSDYQGGYLEGFQNAYREGYYTARNGR